MLAHIVSPNPKTPRDYGKKYRTYHGKPEKIKRREARNKARALMEKKGLVQKGDGLHVDHKTNNPINNRPSNLRAVAAKQICKKIKRKNPRPLPVRYGTAGKRHALVRYATRDVIKQAEIPSERHNCNDEGINRRRLV